MKRTAIVLSITLAASKNAPEKNGRMKADMDYFAARSYASMQGGFTVEWKTARDKRNMDRQECLSYLQDIFWI